MMRHSTHNTSVTMCVCVYLYLVDRFVLHTGILWCLCFEYCAVPSWPQFLFGFIFIFLLSVQTKI